MISDADLRQLERQLPNLDPEHKRRVLELLEERDRLASLQLARRRFIPYMRRMWPEAVLGAHHEIIAEAFEDLLFGDLTRLIINIGPRHTKSEMTSWLLPTWFIGNFPKSKLMQIMNTQDLAASFGRRVRNTVSKEAIATEHKGFDPYHEIFPSMDLAKDSGAATHWHAIDGSEYYGVGIGGKIAGRGADLLVIDDPHTEQEAKQAESNPQVFDDVYDWYVYGPRQRLQPDAKIVLVQCMTGDTPVLRPDGTETPLRDIRPDDEVATYENGSIASARVVNFRSNGVDDVYTVQTRSGRLLRANERHPFLVNIAGVLEWIRLRDLRPGMEFVSLKDVGGLLKISTSQVYATPARLENRTIKNTLTPPIGHSAHTENGGGSCANNAAKTPSTPEGCAWSVIENNTKHRSTLPRNSEAAVSNIVTALHRKNSTSCSRSKMASAPYAESPRLEKILERIGTENFASTIYTAQRSFVGSFATIAISPSGTGKLPPCLTEQQPTSDFTTDEIVSVTLTGRDEVFDVEIERTENFIANGVVSHNTRWSKRDLTGRLVKKMEESTSGIADKWRVINFPAILDEGQPTERSLWPGYWKLPVLQATREALPVAAWQAQYMQNPVSEQAAILKREYWRRWGDDDKERCPGPMHAAAWQNGDPPACDYIIGSWDCASTKNERSHPSAYTLWGVFKAEDPDTGKTVNNIILLSSFTARMEFPELKKRAKEFYDEDNPDTLLIENKAAGIQLLQEFRAMGIPAEDFSGSSRGTKSLPNDKIARANMVVDIFASKYVWAPNRRFADVVIEECASFPAGDTDDLVDSAVQAMIRFRQGGFIRTANDEPEEEPVRRHRKRYY